MKFEDKYPTLAKRRMLVEKKKITREQAAIRREFTPEPKVYRKCGCGFLLRETEFGQYWCGKCRNFYKNKGVKAC